MWLLAALSSFPPVHIPLCVCVNFPIVSVCVCLSERSAIAWNIDKKHTVNPLTPAWQAVQPVHTAQWGQLGGGQEREREKKWSTWSALKQGCTSLQPARQDKGGSSVTFLWQFPMQKKHWKKTDFVCFLSCKYLCQIPVKLTDTKWGHVMHWTLLLIGN